MPPPPKAVAALDAMKASGFDSKEVQPMLKKLVKVYDNTWELIEADGYQVLLDCILEERELKAKLDEQKDAVVSNNQDHNRIKRLKKLDVVSSSQLMLGSEGPSKYSKKYPKDVDVSPVKNFNGRKTEPVSPPSPCSVHNRRKTRKTTLPETSLRFENVRRDLVLRESDFITKIETSEPGIDMEAEDVLKSPVPPALITTTEDLNPARIRVNQQHQTVDKSSDGESVATPGAAYVENYGNKKIGSSSNENRKQTEIVKPPYDSSDITKGEERYRVSIVNEVSNERYPSSFCYMPQNIIYNSARVNISVSKIDEGDRCANCFHDCLSAEIPCACAHKTGGEFAYTSDGLVKDVFIDELISIDQERDKYRAYCKDCPLERCKHVEGILGKCKGHLSRKFIKECWIKCGCSKYCKNRIVQCGITSSLQVFFTPEGKGWGLRTLDCLPKGAFVCEYVGEILTVKELHKRKESKLDNGKATIPVLLDNDWGSKEMLEDEDALCLDAEFYGNVARFVNHRCSDANLIAIPVEVETPDHHYYHVAFFSARKIELLEELTWDYGINFDDVDQPVKAFKCRCGSKLCRDKRRTKSRSKALAQM